VHFESLEQTRLTLELVMDAGWRIFVVDDEPAVLAALERMLRASGYGVETFASPREFLDAAPQEGVGCLLLDLSMPEMTGLDVQDEMLRRGISLPVIFLSAYGDVPTTAHAMREGAIDFLVKPVREAQLLDAITRALSESSAREQRRVTQSDVKQRLSRLTARERQVCDLVSRGLLNKQIAAELGTTEKTIKVHRGRVMRKLEVHSVAALVRLLAEL
jgi:FixJ family two-component response regulator